MTLSAAREPDRHREGEYHVRTDSLAESALMGGAVILMIGERGRDVCTWHTTMWLLCAKLKLAYGRHPWTAPSRMLWAAVGHPPTLRSLSSSSSVTGLPMKLSYHLQEISLIGLHIFSFLHNGKTLIFLPTPGSGNVGRLGHGLQDLSP